MRAARRIDAGWVAAGLAALAAYWVFGVLRRRFMRRRPGDASRGEPDLA
jgi:hypothetical protein